MNYYDRPEISNSFLTAFDRSPAHAFTRKESVAMSQGAMIHEYVLEPEKFLSKYLIVPKVDKRTKEYKTLSESNPDKIIIDESDMMELQAISNNVNNTVFEGVKISEWLKQSEVEKELYFDYNGVPAKSRLDAIHPQFIFDLKTTEDARDFLYSVKSYKYYRQAAFYKKAAFNMDWTDRRFIFIVIEKSAPYGVILYELTDDWILTGMIENDAAVERYKLWSGNKTEGYPVGLKILSMPEYMRRG